MSRRNFGPLQSFGPAGGRASGGTAPSGGGAVVTPDQVSGLALWLDPSDSSTVTMGSNGYSVVNDKASGVGGRSAGDQFLFAPSSNYEPAVTSINGRAAMQFDGSNDYMVLRTKALGSTTNQRMHATGSADGLVINSESVTVIAVVKPVDGSWSGGAVNTYALPGIFDLSAGYGPGCYIYGTNAAANIGLRIYKFTSPGTGDHYVNDGTLQGFPVSGAVAMVWRQQDPGAAPATSYLYGGVDLSAALSTSTSQIQRSYLTYWSQNNCYFGYGYSDYSESVIGEFCVWDRALSDAEVAGMQAYFNQQWGV